ncbi:MAG: hypothetical protein NTY37_07315 [Methanothrix sp.]|nr:hypothetical protein [Methanothrix sp.]
MSFVFGPYNFKNRFGIEETDNATFAFSLNVGGPRDTTGKLPGPIVHQPELTGINFKATPYFFQGISASVGFKDQDGLDPKPTCLLVITGPLGTSESRTWNSDDVNCRSSGKSIYTCTLNEPLSTYRNGGNFTFKLVYNNLKMSPLTFGPYNITLLPYTPAAESPKIDKKLDYTNFTILATVRDASARMEGSNAEGRLIISQPQKGEIAYTSSDPEISGEKLVFRWTNENDPALFNRSDVELSKIAPFTGRFEYKNDKWGFSAKSANVTFIVIEEVPKLGDLLYPANVYISSGEDSPQDMAATVTFSKGPGDLEVRLTGPSMDFKSSEKGTPLGGNKYRYKWPVTFNESHVNNNYTLSLSFLQDQLEGGRYDFVEKKTIHVSPVSVQFLKGDVSLPAGQWNDSYTYSLKMDTTVPLKVQLQIFDPCRFAWIKKETKEAAIGANTSINWTLRPFANECQEMAQQGAKYQFMAIFAGEEIASSQAYRGPTILGAKPTLISLSPESDPMVVYVSEGSESSSSIQAVVEYGADQGPGQATLHLKVPEKNIDETSQGVILGGNLYRYDWSLPFDEADIDKSFNYTISYKHPSLAAEFSLAEKSIDVKAISINFADATVAPDKGKWNDTFTYSVQVNSSVETKVALEVYNPCDIDIEWVERASGTAAPGESRVNLTAKPFKYKCAEAEGKNARYHFVARFEGKTFKSDEYYGPFISGVKTGESGPNSNGINGSSTTSKSHLDVIGNVSPRRGVLQAWQDPNELYAFVYTAHFNNLSLEERPWVELSVKAPGRSWEGAGQKQQYDPAQGNLSWDVKPFYNTEFLGTAEFKFIINGLDSAPFNGPEIVAIYKDLNFNSTSRGKYNYFGKINGSINLTVDLLGSEDKVHWRNIGKPQNYLAGSGEVLIIWRDLPVIRNFEFDIKTAAGEVIS